MFASVISRLPAPLRRALAYAKAFAFLDEPPPALPRRHSARRLPAVAAAPRPTSVCWADRRRRSPGPGPGIPLALQLRSCGIERPHARRIGAVARPEHLCRTPTTGTPSTASTAGRESRRAAAAGGFLHRY